MLSVFGIFLSVTAFLVVMFVMADMNGVIERRVLSLEPHLVFHAAPQSSVNRESFEKVLFNLVESQDVRQISSFESQDVILRTLDGQYRGALARGLDEEALTQFLLEIKRLQKLSMNKREGVETDLSWGQDEPLKQGDVLLGVDVARSLGVFEGDLLMVLTPDSMLLPLGEVPRSEKVRVRKIISSHIANLDSQFLFYVKGQSLKVLSVNPNTERGFEVWLQQGREAESLKKKWIDSAFKVETWKDRNSDLFFALLLEKTVIATFLGLAGFIAVSSVLTVMALLLSQKRRDLALLRVLGMSAQRVEKVFTQIGLSLAGIGLLSGVLAGTLTGLWLQVSPLQILPDIYYESRISARVEFGWVLIVFVSAGVLSFLGAWIPAQFAAKANSIEALRQNN